MKISCPTCAAKYSVADEKIQSRLAKIRCRKCSSTIVIDGMTTPANVYIGEAGAAGATSGPPPDLGAEAAPGSGRFGGVGFSDPASAGSEPVGPAADEYAVDIADNDQRNMTIHQIVGAYNEGIISADTYIWKEGMADWQTLSEVSAVANALHAAARPAGAAPVPAAVRRADNGAAADLFGRIATAGGEDDITTSAPEPAFSAGTGARNESSVLFSLSALTGTPDPGPTQPGGAKRGRGSADDSGLIDLQALTAGEAGGSAGAYGAPASAFGASPLISAPLGGVSGPALGSPLASGYARRSGGRAVIIAASVLAVGIIGAAAVMVGSRGAEDTSPSSSIEPGAAAAAPAKINAQPEPTALAAATEAGETDDPPAEETEEKELTQEVVAADELPAAPEPAAAKPPPRRARVTRRTPTRARAKPAAAAPAPAPAPPPRATTATASTSSATSDAPKKKKKKVTSHCDCKPADLMCAMRCSARN